MFGLGAGHVGLGVDGLGARQRDKAIKAGNLISHLDRSPGACRSFIILDVGRIV